MRCKNCGTKIKRGTAFCPKCGYPVETKRTSGKGIMILLCILAMGTLSLMSYRVYCFLSVGALEKQVEALMQEREELDGQLTVREQEILQMDRYLEALSEIDGGENERRIREYYIAREEAESAARSFVLAKLSDASYITLDSASESVSEMITNEVIDNITGNAVVSAGVKASIEAAAQEMSVENIINSAVEGMAAELPDYITSEITGAAADALGVDIFGITDWISRFMNADDTPVMLANSMVTEQRHDVACVLGFLEKEELTGADMQYMAGIMERIYARGKELEAAGSSAGGDFNGAEQLEELARIWEKNNYGILCCAKIEGAADED